MKNYKKTSTLILLMLLAGITGCIDIQTDPSPTQGEASIGRLANIVIEGDSLTSASSGYGPYLRSHIDQFGIRISNVATGGDSLIHDEGIPAHVGMIVEGPTEVDPLYDGSFQHNIAVVLARNDVGVHTPTEIVAAYNEWGTARKSAGFVTIAITLPVSNDADWEVIRQQINSGIIASHPGFDYICDLGSDTIYGDLSYVGDPIWFADLIHHSDTGRDRVASIVGNTIMGIL